MELRDVVNSEKEKLNTSKSNTEDTEAFFEKEKEEILKEYKQNKDKVVDFLIDNILNVDLSIPQNIKKITFNKK